jgi:hypothetical protein
VCDGSYAVSRAPMLQAANVASILSPTREWLVGTAKPSWPRAGRLSRAAHAWDLMLGPRWQPGALAPFSLMSWSETSCQAVSTCWQVESESRPAAFQRANCPRCRRGFHIKSNALVATLRLRPHGPASMSTLVDLPLQIRTPLPLPPPVSLCSPSLSASPSPFPLQTARCPLARRRRGCVACWPSFPAPLPAPLPRTRVNDARFRGRGRGWVGGNRGHCSLDQPARPPPLPASPGLLLFAWPPYHIPCMTMSGPTGG